MLKINVGETTKDNMFTLLETNDIGMSDKEPSMMINDEVYTDLTPEKVTSILKSIMRDREDIDILLLSIQYITVKSKNKMNNRLKKVDYIFSKEYNSIDIP